MTLIISLGALALLGIVSYLIYKKRYRGLSVALAMCVLSILVGLWAIFQSRSSTAGIGILLLPFYGLFSAIMGWLFSNLREREIQLVRVIGWGCMAISLAVPIGTSPSLTQKPAKRSVGPRFSLVAVNGAISR